MSANVKREDRERKRRERLAASLRENLKRRKAQQRGRSTKSQSTAQPPVASTGAPRAEKE